MKITYSRNKSSELDDVVNKIDLFRQSYYPQAHPGNCVLPALLIGVGITMVGIVLTKAMWFLICPIICFILGIMADKALLKVSAPFRQMDVKLSEQVEKLKEISYIIRVSETIEKYVDRFAGNVNIELEQKSGKYATDPILRLKGIGNTETDNDTTYQLSDVREDFPISKDYAEKTFSHDAIDFSWIDGELTTWYNNTVELIPQDILRQETSAQKLLEVKIDSSTTPECDEI